MQNILGGGKFYIPPIVKNLLIINALFFFGFFSSWRIWYWCGKISIIILFWIKFFPTISIYYAYVYARKFPTYFVQYVWFMDVRFGCWTNIGKQKIHYLFFHYRNWCSVATYSNFALQNIIGARGISCFSKYSISVIFQNFYARQFFAIFRNY